MAKTGVKTGQFNVNVPVDVLGYIDERARRSQFDRRKRMIAGLAALELFSEEIQNELSDVADEVLTRPGAWTEFLGRIEDGSVKRVGPVILGRAIGLLVRQMQRAEEQRRQA